MAANQLTFGSSSTAAEPRGECPNCGTMMYHLLVHHCSTGVRIRCTCYEAGRNPTCPIHANFAGSGSWTSGDFNGR